MKETGRHGLMGEIRLELGKRVDLVIFRNESGAVKREAEEPGDKDRWERYGLAPGASDLIGIRRVEVAPGVWIGRFFALEVKAPGKKPTPEQAAFLRLVEKFGGHAGWCDSVEGAIREYENSGRLGT